MAIRANARNWWGSRGKLLKIVTLLVILGLVLALVLMSSNYSKVKKERDRLANPTESAKRATDELIGKVSKLVQLPQGETPTVATVTDASKLKNQPFFAKAENGDKVLIYTKAKQAFLYRPASDKVIQIAPINIGSSTPAPAPAPVPTPPKKQ